MEDLFRPDAYPIKGLMRQLLQDKTTGKNISLAGAGHKGGPRMTGDAPSGFALTNIQPRAYKAGAERTERTRKNAEVFTPAWIVNRMNDHCDEEWFGRPDVFSAQARETASDKIAFPEGKDWKAYVDSRRLEITCGEAPYIVSRYDAVTGKKIPLGRRVGILDRKMRVVNENAADESEWFQWALRAFQSVYGYEYQGDNLLIARMNLLYTLCDYVQDRWRRRAAADELKEFLNVICWNFWQMDGLNDRPPSGLASDSIPCRIYDWRAGVSRPFKDPANERPGVKFDFVVGNPPYQEDRQGESNTALPVYHSFMDAAYSLSDRVELIHPARFLFNAGRTPKQWNRKMLEDAHFKVLMYEGDASTVFPNTDIKGGVAISYRDAKKEYGAIRTFTVHPELNAILKRVLPFADRGSLADMAFVATKFNTNNLFRDFPQYAGHERRMSSNVLSFECFHPDRRGKDEIQIYGIYEKKRAFRYISEEYVDLRDDNIRKYKIVMPKADGNRAFGNTITMPEILPPDSGFTHTFLGLGGTGTRSGAETILKYIKTRFARALLGIRKVTQDINADKWRYVPLQDFTTNSDIDWSRPIPEIDRQLYRKYGLAQEETDFIETHVKPMGD